MFVGKYAIGISICVINFISCGRWHSNVNVSGCCIDDVRRIKVIYVDTISVNYHELCSTYPDSLYLFFKRIAYGGIYVLLENSSAYLYYKLCGDKNKRKFKDTSDMTVRIICYDAVRRFKQNRYVYNVCVVPQLKISLCGKKIITKNKILYVYNICHFRESYYGDISFKQIFPPRYINLDYWAEVKLWRQYKKVLIREYKSKKVND